MTDQERKVLPIGPEDRFEHVLPGGRGVLVCRYLSMREMRRYQERLRDSTKENTLDENAAAMLGILGMFVVDGRGLIAMDGSPIEWSGVECLEELYTAGDLFDLAIELPQSSFLSETDRKKSAPPSSCSTADSAATAVAGDATETPEAASNCCA